MLIFLSNFINLDKVIQIASLAINLTENILNFENMHLFLLKQRR